MIGGAEKVNTIDQSVLQRNNNFLRNEYRKVLFPIMFSVLGGTINALIDSVFVSRRMGISGLSAVNMSLPVYLVLCTLGSLVASGAAVLSAREEGRDNPDKAGQLYRTAMAASLFVGLLSTVLGLVLLGPVADLLAGGSSIRPGIEAYCRVTFAGAAVYIVSYLPLYYLLLEGKTDRITRMILLMVATDVVLDYLLLYPLALGLTGAALASVIAMLVSCVYGFFALESGSDTYRFRLQRPSLSELGEIAQYGSPAALGNLYDALRLLAINALILSAGGESAVAVWAVLNTLSEFSMVITTGVPRAGSAMLGVYHAARENGGIRTLIRLEVGTGLMLSLVFAAVGGALSGPIRLLYRLPEPMLLPLLCLGIAVLFNTLCCILETCFNAAGRIGLSNVLVALRRLILPAAVLWALSAGQGVLWLFLPLGGLLSLLCCLLFSEVLALRSRRSGLPLSRILLLDDSLTRENKVLDFSIPADIDEACKAAERISDFCALHDMNKKLVVRLGLSIEELLSVVITKCPEIESVDLRVFVLDNMTGIRIRCAGQNYDPFQDQSSDSDFLMGVEMLKKLADVTVHSYTLGFNTLNIIFGRDEHEREYAAGRSL